MAEQPETELPPDAPEPADDEQASPFSVGVNWGQRRQIARNAADYGAVVGRPVSVAEFLRTRGLESVPATVAS
jgi:hypothetical protein